MKRVVLAALFAVFALPALAQKPAGKAEPKPTIIKPGKFAETCMVVTAAQKLEYQFTASKPVDFNIHFHVGETVYYPVKRNKTTSEGDRFQPTKPREEYCLMWENKSPSTDVELTYTAKVVK